MIGQAPQATSLLPEKWIKRITKWVIAIVILVLVASRMQGCAEAEKKERARVTAAAARAQAPVEMTLSCGGEGEYRQLPEVRSVILTLNPTGEACSTAWLRLPRKATNLFSDPAGDIKMQLAVGDGEILPWLDDGPLINRPGGPMINGKQERRTPNTVRYKNLGGASVKIPLTLSYQKSLFLPFVN